MRNTAIPSYVQGITAAIRAGRPVTITEGEAPVTPHTRAVVTCVTWEDEDGCPGWCRASLLPDAIMIRAVAYVDEIRKSREANPCPTCEGTGRVPGDPQTMAGADTCEACDGTGLGGWYDQTAEGSRRDQTLAQLTEAGHVGAGQTTIICGIPEDVAQILRTAGVKAVTRYGGSSYLGKNWLILCTVITDTRLVWIVGPRQGFRRVAQALRDYASARHCRLIDHRTKVGDRRATLPDPLYRYDPAPCIIRAVVAEWLDDGRLFAKGFSPIRLKGE